jgi:hypothetical protein
MSPCIVRSRVNLLRDCSGTVAHGPGAKDSVRNGEGGRTLSSHSALQASTPTQTKGTNLEA